MKELWVDKYSPKSLDDYVFRDTKLRQDVNTWLTEGCTPHLIFSGPPGTGKSSLVKLLFRLLGVPRGDILWKNGSHDTSVEMIRAEVINFASTMSFGEGLKYVVFDEGERLSLHAQDMLKGVIEQYTNNCRFIFTTNNANKIIPAISDSRCGGSRYHIDKLDQEQFMMRAIQILQSEDVRLETEQDLNLVNSFVQASYPDMRKCIGLLQNNVKTIDEVKILVSPDAKDTAQIMDDYKLKAIEHFKAGRITEGRKVLVEHVKSDEYEDLYRLFYRNLSWWGAEQEQQDNAILAIRDGLYKDSLVADREICLSATLVQLCQIKNSK